MPVYFFDRCGIMVHRLKTPETTVADIADMATENVDSLPRNGIDIARMMLPNPNHVSAFQCKDVECGVDIPEARRQALPGVRYCVDCAPRHVSHIRRDHRTIQ